MVDTNDLNCLRVVLNDIGCSKVQVRGSSKLACAKDTSTGMLACVKDTPTGC